MRIRSNTKPLQGFSFASLTDIVLMLLIFFLLSSSFIIQDGFKMQLPRSQTADTHEQRSITISIDKTGQIFLNGEGISSEQLGANLRSLIVANPESAVVLRSHSELPVQKLVTVMDLAKAAGAVRFLIATQNDF